MHTLPSHMNCESYLSPLCVCVCLFLKKKKRVRIYSIPEILNNYPITTTIIAELIIRITG